MTKINLHQITPLKPLNPRKTVNTHPKHSVDSFKNVLNGKLAKDKIKFSGHCLKRLQESNIELSKIQIEKIEKAVDKVEKKGAKESLVMMDNLALLVSVKNRTVITAVDGERMKDNVFTNIDSAVIV